MFSFHVDTFGAPNPPYIGTSKSSSKKHSKEPLQEPPWRLIGPLKGPQHEAQDGIRISPIDRLGPNMSPRCVHKLPWMPKLPKIAPKMDPSASQKHVLDPNPGSPTLSRSLHKKPQGAPQEPPRPRKSSKMGSQMT